MRTIQTARKTAAARQLQYKERLKSKKKLRVVEEKSRRIAPLPKITFPVFALSVTLFTAGLIVNVAQHALVSQLNYEIESIKKNIQLAQQAQEQILAQKAKLESPKRIESIATTKLYMVKAPKISYLRVSLDNPVASVDIPSNDSHSDSISGISYGSINTGNKPEVTVQVRAMTSGFSHEQALSQ